MGSEIKRRWQDYVLIKDDKFETFWKSYFEDKKNVLIILGLGFDPRASIALKKLVFFHNKGTLECKLIKYKLRDIEDPETASFIEENENQIKKCLNSNKYSLQEITLGEKGSELNAISYEILTKFDSQEELSNYSDIILDISALPRYIYYPLLNKLCQTIDNRLNGTVNLHVVVTENPELDSNIQQKGLKEEATYIPTLSIRETELTSKFHKVWIPILGEGQVEHIKKIDKFVEPVEIAPVLPFPAENLRRGDNLIEGYNHALFGSSNQELNNIIYSDESNPFQTYRNLISTFQRYKESFDMIEGCKIVVSVLSSKLLSIGAFLAVYEAYSAGYNIGITHVQALDHELLVTEEDLQPMLLKNKLYSAWITGEPYK